MANPENIEKHQFKKGKEWTGCSRGRTKGSKNRATIVREALEFATNELNPLTENETDAEEQEFTQEEIMTLRMIQKAKEGDVKAYTAIMDSAFGKPKQEVTKTITDQRPPKVRFTDEPEFIDPDEEENL